MSEGHAIVWSQLKHLKAPKPQPVVIDCWKWQDFDVNHALFLLAYTENGDPRNLVAEMWQNGSVDSAAQFLTAEFLRILCLTCP